MNARYALSLGIVGILALLVPMSGAAAERTGLEALAEHFILPEMLRQAHEAIGLTDEQKQELRTEAEATQSRIAELRETLEKETAKFAEMAAKPQLDEKALLAQGDKLLDIDSTIKRTQLTLLIRIKNKLTPEQVARVNQFKKHQASMREKMQQIAPLVQQWRDAGKDLSALEQDKQQYDELMRLGKFAEAEALLDKAMKTLKGEK